ncbi:hypothetical protein MKEN_01114300 [Mycena kentingensis (nom. inval.)]|nr:hypothetical protein MKEN_01114300 [Mycena kentingensis (nom. inval.)]
MAPTAKSHKSTVKTHGAAVAKHNRRSPTKQRASLSPLKKSKLKDSTKGGAKAEPNLPPIRPDLQSPATINTHFPKAQHKGRSWHSARSAHRLTHLTVRDSRACPRIVLMANGPHAVYGQPVCSSGAAPKLRTMRKMDTEYIHMLVAMENTPLVYKILAYITTWTLLAGFLIAPGTFTAPASQEETDALGSSLQQHMALLTGAWILTGVGSTGIFLLWFRWHSNYLWVHDSIFIPALLNSLAGVLSSISSSTFARLFSSSDSDAVDVSLSFLGTSEDGTDFATLNGNSPLTSYSKIVVTGMFAFVFSAFVVYYKFELIVPMEREHNRQIAALMA